MDSEEWHVSRQAEKPCKWLIIYPAVFRRQCRYSVMSIQPVDPPDIFLRTSKPLVRPQKLTFRTPFSSTIRNLQTHSTVASVATCFCGRNACSLTFTRASSVSESGWLQSETCLNASQTLEGQHMFDNYVRCAPPPPKP